MPVYVDNATNQYGRMKMCHMVADTLEELHAMATRIGMDRSWFQDHPRHPHYDVSLSRRRQALMYGAIEMDSRQLVKRLQSKERTMSISSKLDEGHIYQLVQAAIKMRSLQRQRGRVLANEAEIHAAEILFDAKLDSVLKDIDGVDTERVIKVLHAE